MLPWSRSLHPDRPIHRRSLPNLDVVPLLTYSSVVAVGLRKQSRESRVSILTTPPSQGVRDNGVALFVLGVFALQARYVSK